MNKDKNQKSDRRSFLRCSGAVVSAALVPATAHAASQVAFQVDDHTEIRKLYRDFITKQSDHLRVLHDPSHDEDTIELAPDSRTAIARFHCLVENATPLIGDSPLLEMARQQGLNAEQWWESGVHQLTCTKAHGEWRLESASYRKLHAILPITR